MGQMPGAVLVPCPQLVEDTPIAVELGLHCIQGLAAEQIPQVPTGSDGGFTGVEKERLETVYSLIYTGLVARLTSRVAKKALTPADEKDKLEHTRVTPLPRRSA